MKLIRKILVITIILGLCNKIFSCTITLVNDSDRPELFVNTQRTNKDRVVLAPKESKIIGDPMDHAHFIRYKSSKNGQFEPFQKVSQTSCAPDHKIVLKTSELDTCAQRNMCSVSFFAVSPYGKDSSNLLGLSRFPKLPVISPQFRMHKPAMGTADHSEHSMHNMMSHDDESSE